ncbi:MAG: hypothetical protein GX454_12480 [Brooklawnia sp.]|nr:hypothetical protein [Brooklawnia sp.]
MSGPFTTFAQARLVATGSSLEIDPPDLAPSCWTEAELKTLVSAYYKFFNENLAKETSFLLKLRPNRELPQLRRLIYNLRSANEHSDNSSAQEAAARWRAKFDTPQQAADALAAELLKGIEILSRIAVAVSRDPDKTAEWKQLLSVDTGTVFSAVASDLGLRFRASDLRRMVRNVEKRIEIQPGSGDRRVLMAEYCAQEILSDRRPLPVPYDQVLDSLGLLGTQSAAGAILIAHSVSEVMPNLRGDAFLARVEATWRTAGAQ